MSHQRLIDELRGHRGPTAKTLDEHFEQAGPEAWWRLCDVARGYPGLITDDVVDWIIARVDSHPRGVFLVLLNLAARDERRRSRMVELYREIMPKHPGAALGIAGHHLFEHHHLMSREWIDFARARFDQDPEGAWGVYACACSYEVEFVQTSDIDWFESRRAAAPNYYFRSMFCLAGHWPDRASDLLGRVLRAFPETPAAAIEETGWARDRKHLLTPALIAAVLERFAEKPDKAWEFFDGACKTDPALFDDVLLNSLEAKATSEPGSIFSILRHLMDVQGDRLPSLLDRYVPLIRRHPAAGIQSVRYSFQRDEIRKFRPDLVKAVCAGFAAAPYYAYEILWHCIEDRPELVGTPEVEAALLAIPHATNRAFGFFKELLTRRPEFTREATLALFECLAQEPVHRAFVRAEEMDAITAISQAAHIKTGLENALREPPRIGSRRARAFMAIMFRQKLRARRHVLLEALRYAAQVVLWRKIPRSDLEPDREDSEKYSPIWDFLMFIIDHASDDAISTAAAERFLEGAFQLHYLCRTGAEHDEFLRKFNLGYPPHRPFPAGAEFLDADPSLARLYSLVLDLGARFAAEPRLAPLEAFAGRREAATRELAAIETQLRKADDAKRRRLEERQKSLRFEVDCWSNPEYARAFADPAVESALSEGARALLRREKKDLAKHLRDALRSEAIRIAVAAVEQSRVELYRHRLRDALGRDVDIHQIEPKILSAFLWFQAIGGMANNTKYLRRLIEDRIAKRPHDWLRTEPAALEWAERVRGKQPGIQLDRWRAPFSRDFQYRPKDALAEKKRRIKADLVQARSLLEKAGAKGIASESYEELHEKLKEIRAGIPEEKKDEKEGAVRKLKPVDPAVLEEIEMNLQRVRLAEQTPDSDFEGKITLTVETDPFEILFMGEYGFASCLSLRGSNAWSAVSNAVDIDKIIVWAKEPAGNVVGRRLLALIPDGILTFRTYTNRHGMALDPFFEEFIKDYAAHCGARIVHGGRAGPLLSDRWYDDGAI